MNESVARNFNIHCPEELLEGHYADFASIWHNQDAFVLDFVSMAAPPQPAEDGAKAVNISCRVVTRVRIPASQVWEVMKALEKQYSAWEIETGRRTAGDGG